MTQQLRGVLIGVLLLAGCGGGETGGARPPAGPPTNVLARVIVSTSVAQIEVDETAVAAARGVDAQERPVTLGATVFSAGTPAIATVTNAGLIRGVTPGRATVIADVDGQRGETTITVVPIPVAQIVVSPGPMTLVPARTQPLVAAVLDRRGLPLAGRAVQWRSSNPAVAQVDSTGLVSAVGGGVTTIAATAEGVTGTIAVTVTTSEGRVTRIAVAPTTVALRVGEQAPFNFALSDSLGRDATGRVFRWLSTEPRVATVDQNGLVIARDTGSTRIRVLSEGSVGEAVVTVTPSIDQGMRLLLIRPEEGASFIDTVRVVIDVRSPARVTEATLLLNGRPTPLALLPFSAGLNTFLFWQGGALIEDLPLGANVATIVARDAAGRRGEFRFTFRREARDGGGGTRPPTPVK